jgi:large subunit ribosomal protein L32e
MNVAKLKFLRRNTREYKRLGRKKLKRWRMPRGRHNKIREHIRGKPMMPTIGFKKASSKQICIPVIQNLKELENVEKGQSIIIAHVGKRNRQIIAEKAKEKQLKVLN